MGRGTSAVVDPGTSPHGLATTARRPPLPAGPYLVVGLGRAGAAAARALSSRAGATDVRVWDGAAEAPQRERAHALESLGVEVCFGGDGVAALEGVRTVVKSPGVPLDAPVIAAAAARDLPIVDEFQIGWQLVPSPTIAVTGTNGKSTVAALCVSVLDAHGLKPVLAGNTEYGPALSELSTEPAPRSIVAEVSSYQAECSPQLAVDGAVFTNLTPEHLNRHESMAAYGLAKRALFVHGASAVPVAALNADDELGRVIAGDVERRGGRALRYGRDAEAEYRVLGCRWGLRHAEMEIDAPGGPVCLLTRLPGSHNAANVIAALALADGLGLSRERTVRALERTSAPPGRFEVVDVDRPFDVVVDFAYGVDSVAAALATARAVVEPRGGRLLTVLAIVGRAGPLTGRDVGRLAREHSDHLVLSGTSYRGEPRIVTLAELVAGARNARGGTVEVAIDRRKAIARCLTAARPGDIVVVLGRGPNATEATDARGGSLPLDDRQAIRELA